MTPEQKKAKDILIKYIRIICSECEHDSYCDRPECNKLGYTFCHVDYAKAKACAIEEVKAVLQIYKHDYNFNYWRSVFFLKVLTEIEKL